MFGLIRSFLGAHPDEPSAAVARIVPPPWREREEPTGLAFPSSGAAIALVIEQGDTPTDQRVLWWGLAPGHDRLDRMALRVRDAYPGAVLERRPEHEDPTQPRDGEYVVAASVRPTDDPVITVSAEHLESVLADIRAEAMMDSGQRLVIVVRGSDAAGEAGRVRGREEADSSVPPRGETSGGGFEPQDILHFVLIGAALVSVSAYFWWVSEGSPGLHEIWPLLVPPAVCLLGLGIAGVRVLRSRWYRRLRLPPLDRELVADKLDHLPMQVATVEVRVMAPEGTDPRRAADAARRVAEVLNGRYGPGWEVGPLREPRNSWTPHKSDRAILNTLEVARLLPSPLVAGPGSGINQASAQRLAPTVGRAAHGYLLGHSDALQGREIRLPPAVLQRSLLTVARTGEGKSTLLGHIVSGHMERQSTAVDQREIMVIVDTHSRLVESVLTSIPCGLEGRTAHIDFGHATAPPSMNVADPRVWGDVTRQASDVADAFARLWLAWGDRSHSLLELSMHTLLLANASRPADRRYTLLTVPDLLSNQRFRAEIVREADSSYLAEAWQRRTAAAPRAWEERTDPLDHRLRRLQLSPAARGVFGTPESTVEPRALLGDYDVVLIDGASATLGREVAEMITTMVIAMFSSSIVEQSATQPTTGPVTMIVDEAASLAGLDYAWALSETLKNGVSWVLATQSLARLDHIDSQLTPTILTNIAGLVAFGTGHDDARRLASELGPPVEPDDLIGLDRHHAYGSWTEDRQRVAPFSFVVAPPREPTPEAVERAERIRAASRTRFGRGHA